MQNDTGIFEQLPDGEQPKEGYSGPYTPGDVVAIGMIRQVHKNGLTLKVARPGDVIVHLGQEFKVMGRDKDGDVTLRSMKSLPKGEEVKPGAERFAPPHGEHRSMDALARMERLLEDKQGG